MLILDSGRGEREEMGDRDDRRETHLSFFECQRVLCCEVGKRRWRWRTCNECAWIAFIDADAVPNVRGKVNAANIQD